MRAPNQIFSKVILLYKGKRAGLRLTLQNVFVFLFLGNEVQKVFPYECEGRARSRSQMLSKLETDRHSQWTLAWYEHLVELITVISSLVNEIDQ